MPSVSLQDLEALHGMIEQAKLIVSSEPMPKGGIERLRELLDTAEQSAGLLARANTKKRSYRRTS